jgi:uncharacterized membrane protein
MTYTIAWGVFAFGWLVAGILRRLPAARWAALALLGAAMLKLFLHDLARLEALYRSGAFLGAAIIAMAASFAYQRFLAGAAKPEPPPQTVRDNKLCDRTVYCRRVAVRQN